MYKYDARVPTRHKHNKYCVVNCSQYSHRLSIFLICVCDTVEDRVIITTTRK
jgi:hypothetical protein